MGKRKTILLLTISGVAALLAIEFLRPRVPLVSISEINSQPQKFKNLLVRVVGTILLSYPNASVIEDGGEAIFVLNMSEVYSRSDRIEVIGKVITVEIGEGKVARWVEAISTRLLGRGYPFQLSFQETAGENFVILGDFYINKLIKISNLTLASIKSSSDEKFFFLNFTQLNVECFLRKTDVDPQILKEGENYEILGFLTYIVIIHSSLFRIVEIQRM